MLSFGTNITATNDQLRKVQVEYLYHSLSNPKPDIKAQINQLRIIRDVDVKQYSLLKRKLPYVVCAHFNPQYRRTENFAYTEYFFIDIDHISAKEMSIDDLRARLQNDNRIVMLFLSPGEDGLKLLFKLKDRCYDAGLYTLFYKAFLRKFSTLYSLEQVIDEHTCDVCRACFVSIDQEAYYNKGAQTIDINSYINTANPAELFDIQREFDAECHNNKCAIKEKPLGADDETINRIKSLLNPKHKNKNNNTAAPFVPEQLNEIINELKSYIENTGVSVYDIVNIQYGKKMRLKLGYRLGEINLFYGKQGFSIVKTPRNGTSPDFNELMAGLINEFLISKVL